MFCYQKRGGHCVVTLIHRRQHVQQTEFMETEHEARQVDHGWTPDVQRTTSIVDDNEYRQLEAPYTAHVRGALAPPTANVFTVIIIWTFCSHRCVR